MFSSPRRVFLSFSSMKYLDPLLRQARYFVYMLLIRSRPSVAHCIKSSSSSPFLVSLPECAVYDVFHSSKSLSVHHVTACSLNFLCLASDGLNFHTQQLARSSIDYSATFPWKIQRSAWLSCKPGARIGKLEKGDEMTFMSVADKWQMIRWNRPLWLGPHPWLGGLTTKRSMKA